MNDEAMVRDYLVATVTEGNSVVFLRMMNLGPDVYRRMIDALINGSAGLSEIAGMQINDQSISAFLDQREEDMGFTYPANAPTDAASAAYCSSVLGLSALISASGEAATSFVRTEWPKLCLRTSIGPSGGGPYYDSINQIAAEYISSVASALPDVRVALPIDPAALDTGALGIEGATLLRRIYSEAVLGRGLVEALHTGEPWKAIVSVGMEPALLLRDPPFAEELFNGYYPYRNVLLLARSFRSTVYERGGVMLRSDAEMLVTYVSGETYGRFVRNKLTYLMAASWAASRYFDREASDHVAALTTWQAAKDLFDQDPSNPDPGEAPVYFASPYEALARDMGTAAAAAVSILDFLKDYIKALSGACSRLMRVG